MSRSSFVRGRCARPVVPSPQRGACVGCDLAALCRPAFPNGSTGWAGGDVVRRFRTVARGDFVLRAGDPLYAVCAVCVGAVKTCTFDADGYVQLAGLHIAGELLGADALAGRRCRCDAIALEPTRICEIPLARLEALSEGAPEWRRALFTVLAREILHRHEGLCAQLGKKDASARLAAFLLHLSRRHAAHGFSPSEFALRLSQVEIGAYLGLAKETVCRAFARLERQGLIRLCRENVYVGDLEVLARAAGDVGWTAER